MRELENGSVPYTLSPPGTSTDATHVLALVMSSEQREGWSSVIQSTVNQSKCVRHLTHPL